MFYFVDKKFEDFFLKIISGDAIKPFSLVPVPDFDFFPKVDQQTISKTALPSKIQENLKPDRPLMLKRICIVRKNEQTCEKKGYPCGSRCRV